ncbi:MULTISPECIES: pyrroline-5-carboxylate reductase [Pyrobaculum]|uniref:Pyrroline-5-carboxylate reductase n=2 Tax=Pyrobaculum arsenaticum TaxID=121277 RepID=A4WMP6_PYRAR|nr:pyrroline-5-carboxylate reductase [Pyrobaculum arsenaticum]ABP51663.1 pyrroline-5-carboxylate reductase [Pyrobaculum arsenaticum DSM 13514]MCY0890704.1 pyrroline-5-carboxylate reductase [Pyrobaculum arsenaticum]NYR15983.1 pyrroline-5-carboxylate reductase [Pyrobaculum arsenaticum]
MFLPPCVPQLTVGVIGAGKLGSQIALRLHGNSVRVLASVKTERSRQRLLALGLETYTDNKVVVENSDVVILSVKPSNLSELDFRVDKPVISFVAGATLDYLRRFSPRPYRAMTNVGLTAIAVAGNYDEEVDKLLSHIAPTFWVEEKLIDPLTVLLGSGPAIVAELATALIRAGVNIGVPWDLSREIVLSLMASLPSLDDRFTLEKLPQYVATPGGTTIKALVAMASAEEVIAKALEEALNRISKLRQ